MSASPAAPFIGLGPVTGFSRRRRHFTDHDRADALRVMPDLLTAWRRNRSSGDSTHDVAEIV